MTIKIYPNRLEVEPIETHHISADLSIESWIKTVAPSYSAKLKCAHPTIEVNGQAVDSVDWASHVITPADDVRIWVEPRGSGLVGGLVGGLGFTMWSATTAAAGYAAKALIGAIAKRPPKAPSSSSSAERGSTLESAGAFANVVRWGEPVPEIAGAPLTFPDYLTPARHHFVSLRQQRTLSLLCIGAGRYQVNPAEVYLGDTPIQALGDDVRFKIYQPGEQLSAEHAEWWHSPEEVGFTTFGGSGITLGTEGGDAAGDTWDTSFAFSGATITGGTPPPWAAGALLRILAPTPIYFSGDTLQSEMLDSLGVVTGDTFELEGSQDGLYVISDVEPASPGDPGVPALITGTSPPADYDFDTEAASLTITFAGTPYVVMLNSALPDIDALVLTLNAQLNSTKVRARATPEGALELYQLLPYDGESIALVGSVARLFGAAELQQGAASVEGHGKKYAVDGSDFGQGSAIAAIGRPGFLYSVTSVAGNTITVTPENQPEWAGFPDTISSAASTITQDTSNLPGAWLGPFVAVPRGELADAFEVDVFFPQGLIHYDNKGKKKSVRVRWEVRWRYVGDSSWTVSSYSRSATTPDQLGQTIRVALPTPGRIEVTVRRIGWDGRSNSSEEIQWTGLRARLLGAPTVYPHMTVAHVDIRSGDRISGASENRLSLRAVRILPSVDDPTVELPTRDIAPYFIHMMQTVGYGRDVLDMQHLSALHSVWRARGDTFDLSVNSSSTLKTVANYCLAAGFAELTVARGKISAARESAQFGPPTRVFSPQEMVGHLTQLTETVMPDDIDGVDVEYLDFQTGRELTVSYRLPSDLGMRVETIKAPGVTSRVAAWRIAARHRRALAYQRTAFQGRTELAAMNSYYLDYIGLQDGVPGWGQSAFVLSRNPDPLLLTLSEEVLPVAGQMQIAFRLPDGTVSQSVSVAEYDGRNVRLEAWPEGAIVSTAPGRNTVVYIGSESRIMHKALITEVAPSGENNVSFRAVILDNRVYAEDDNLPPPE